MKSQCWLTTITIDGTDAIFPSPTTLTYYVLRPQSDILWSDADVTISATDPSIDCGPMEFLIVNSADESAIDTTVFTATLDGNLGAT